MTIGPRGAPPRSSEPLCVRITWCTGATSGGEDETMGGVIYGQPREPPPSLTTALEPTASSFGSAALRLRFRRQLTASVRLPEPGSPKWQHTAGGVSQ